MEGPASKQALQLGTRAEALANAAVILDRVGDLPPNAPPPPPVASPPPPAVTGQVTALNRMITVLFNPGVANPGALRAVPRCGQRSMCLLAMQRCRRDWRALLLLLSVSHATLWYWSQLPACDKRMPSLSHPADPSLFRCTGSRVPAGSGPDISAPAVRIPNTPLVGADVLPDLEMVTIEQGRASVRSWHCTPSAHLHA